MEATPQDNPRFLASAEYLIHFGLSSHKRFPLNKRDPRWHKRALVHELRFFIEQTDEGQAAELLVPTLQERPRLLASTE